MDLKNKYDRLIVLISFGILIISCVFTMSIVFYQDIEKENKEMEQRQIEIAENHPYKNMENLPPRANDCTERYKKPLKED